MTFKIIKELPNQMSYYSENIFLPIYNAGINGVFEPTGNERLKNMNNPFYLMNVHYNTILYIHYS